MCGQELILYHRSQRDQVLTDVPATVNVGAFSVNLQEPRQFLSKKHGDVVSKLLETMLNYVRTNGAALLSTFSSISKELVRIPRTVEVRFDAFSLVL
jgi:hypothetical protein